MEIFNDVEERAKEIEQGCREKQECRTAKGSETAKGKQKDPTDSKG